MKGEERSRTRVVHIDKFRGTRSMDEVLNVRIKELCGVTNGVDERIDEGVLRLYGHVDKMENNRIAKRVYVGEYADNYSVVGRGRGGLIP